MIPHFGSPPTAETWLFIGEDASSPTVFGNEPLSGSLCFAAQLSLTFSSVFARNVAVFFACQTRFASLFMKSLSMHVNNATAGQCLDPFV